MVMPNALQSYQSFIYRGFSKNVFRDYKKKMKPYKITKIIIKNWFFYTMRYRQH